MPDGKKKLSLLDEFKEAVRQLLRKKEKPPEGDPHSYVGAPLRRGPKGRSGAAAAEPEDDDFHAYPPRR